MNPPLDPSEEPPSLVGLLDGLVDGGVHVAGDLSIGLADVQLIRVALRVLVASEETAQRTGVRTARHAVPTAHPAGHARPRPATDPIAGGTPPPRPRPVGRLPTRPDDAEGTSIEDADRERLVRGVSQLVLTVVELIRDLLERQAIRRVEAGDLDDDQVERLGVALQALEDRMAEVKETFGLTDDDLNLDLGPLGRLR